MSFPITVQTKKMIIQANFETAIGFSGIILDQPDIKTHGLHQKKQDLDERVVRVNDG